MDYRGGHANRISSAEKAAPFSMDAAFLITTRALTHDETKG